MPPAADTTATNGRLFPALDGLARRLGVAGFWRWWTGELAPLVPAGTRAAIERRRTRPVVAFDGDAATVWQAEVVDGALRMTEKARIALAGDAGAVAAAGQTALAAVARDPERRVVVALPLRQVLRRSITLPAAVEENLRQSIAYDLDRHTPFKPEDLYFDAAVVERDAARGTIRVDLATVRRTILDQAVRHVESFGGTAVAVVPSRPPRRRRRA